VAEPDLTAERAYEAMRLLTEIGNAAKKDLWARVTEKYPQSDLEQEKFPSGSPRGIGRWSLETANFAGIGWLTKDGPAGWTITDLGREAVATTSDPFEFVRTARTLYSQYDRARDKERKSALASHVVPVDDAEAKVIQAAREFVERALLAGESVFAPGRVLWTEPIVNELVVAFVGAESVPGMRFTEQLAVQLEGVSDDAKLLMAELVMLQLLPASTSSIGARKKAERIEGVLALMQHPVQIPAEFAEVFKDGAFNPGTRMSNALGAAMSIIVNFAAAWIGTDPTRRDELLDDPWAFREFVLGVSGENFPSQRWSLMFLVHPGTFMSIVSDEHKRLIRAAFLGEIGGVASDDMDKDLLAITLALQVKNQGPANYYRSPLREKWQPEAVVIAEVPERHDEAEPADREPFPRVTDALGAELFMDATWLQETCDLLERKRQIVLYGPPGTGKTYLATALAQHVSVGVEPTIVQFHPSYSYEDFVEGYRPMVENGSLVYKLKAGPFLQLAREARDNGERSYVLVIDEINRSNIAKVFGELYFLLEYRNQKINLLYGDEQFELPSNVFIIGTMNTTDRSIALLDAAMRRRFAFVELHPDTPPTSMVLERWLAHNGQSDEPAQLLAALNGRIEDPSARVGPSYLMQPNLSDALLRQIWKHEIMPLLEETYYGDGRDLEAQFGLDSLRRQLARSADEM
jgi:hypothetical protein